MYKLVVVLFALNSAVVCSSLTTKDYQQPVATSYTTREDDPGDGKRYGFGVSKKYGYNKMIVTTFLAPVPEEASASYSNYVIHPVDKEHCGYNKAKDKASLTNNPIVIEDTAETSNSLKLFPIIVEESDEGEGLQEEPRQEYLGYREMAKKDDGESYSSWFTNEEPKGKNVLDEEVQDLYLTWFEKDGPRTTGSAGYWKSLKNNFDTFYEDEFKQFFDDDSESDKYKESESDKKDEEIDWFPEIPYHYEYEDESGGGNSERKNEGDYHAYKPKNDFTSNFYSNDNDDFYRWWNGW